MQNEQLFNELGINPIRAVELMDILDLSPDDLSIPQTFVRLQTVIEFLKDYPEDTQRFLIKKATFNKQDKLKVLHEYAKILKEKNFYETVAQKINKEKSAFDMTDDFIKKQEITEREALNNAKLSLLRDELEIYHK